MDMTYMYETHSDVTSVRVVIMQLNIGTYNQALATDVHIIMSNLSFQSHDFLAQCLGALCLNLLLYTDLLAVMNIDRCVTMPTG